MSVHEMAHSSLSSGRSPPHRGLSLGFPSVGLGQASQRFPLPQSYRLHDHQYSASEHRLTQSKVVSYTRGSVLATMTNQKHRTPQTDRFADSFPLMRLPGEQREAIYRALFDDLVSETQEINVWSKSLPVYNLRAYVALIRTCRQVRREACSVFLKEYLPQTVWYFDDLHHFHRFSTSAATDQLKAADVCFVLKTPVVTAVSHGVSTM